MFAPERPPTPATSPLPPVAIPTPRDALAVVQAALNAGGDPLTVIAALAPTTPDEATRWVRFLPAFEEYHREFPAQVIGVAAVIARRAMREHRLTVRPDGRVAPAWPEGAPRPPPAAPVTFSVNLQGQAVQVEYVRDYFPVIRTDHFQFTSPQSPPRPLPMSPTGYLSHFAPGEQVDALGGPKAYVERLCEALAAGREGALRAALEGEWPKPRATRRGTRPARKSQEAASPPPPFPGRVPPASPVPPVPPAGERTLFDDEPADP